MLLLLGPRARTFMGLVGLILMVSTATTAASERVDNTTLTGKMIMGYQGWFGCPGDGSGRGWRHWKSGDQFTVDMLPDTSELTPEEKCDSGLKTASGEPVFFFSNQNPLTVDRHFLWMEQYGLDGVALQKFASVLGNDLESRSADQVLDNVRRGAEHHGRVFFLMYDLSGLQPEKLDSLAQDWARLKRAGLVDSPAYLHHKGKPVLGVWGLGFKGRDLPPAAIAGVLDRLKAGKDSGPAATIVGGVPAHWRTGDGDADPDPGWKTVWSKLDVISPWTVGSYADNDGAQRYRDRALIADLAATKAMGVDYMPVAFPGFSWANLMHARHLDAKAIKDQIPRHSGQFYWKQVLNAMSAGANMVYTAMFDEVDEGTAMFKLKSVSRAGDDAAFVAINDGQGYPLPQDWFLSLAGAATRAVSGGAERGASFSDVEKSLTRKGRPDPR